MAIEIEKKFLLGEAEKQKLIEGAHFISTKIFSDTYYDNDAYALTSKDLWLRMREGRWELKVTIKDGTSSSVDRYHELETEEDIANYLKLSKNLPLEQALLSLGYQPFVTIKTTRSKYSKDGFTIDLDSMDFGYALAEIEKIVEKDEEMEQAAQDILSFAAKHSLRVQKIRGKVIEYLRRNNPEHFKVLVNCGVVDQTLS